MHPGACGSMCARTCTPVTVNMCRSECVRESVGDVTSMCALGRLVLKNVFHSKRMHSAVSRCVWVWNCIYLCCVGSQAAGVTVVLWAAAELTAH